MSIDLFGAELRRFSSSTGAVRTGTPIDDAGSKPTRSFRAAFVGMQIGVFAA
jgi:hypothetical protein